MRFGFKDLMIEGSGLAVVSFGRFNPPTIGHEKVIEKVKSVAGNAPFRVYPSHTVGPKDPLPHAKKVAYMRKMFPKYKKNIVADKDAKTIINIAEKLYKEGFDEMIMVAGSDRVREFDTLLQKYNGKPDRKGKIIFDFKSIEVVNAGQRDPDSEGVEGMSASKMRVAASDSDFDSFKNGIPSTLNDKDKKKLYLDVRKHMGIREAREMGELTDFESMRDAYLTGQVWKIGDVVEANGHTGKVINRGTNYLSFTDEDGKVHKTWLHDIGMLAPTGQIFALKVKKEEVEDKPLPQQFDESWWKDLASKMSQISHPKGWQHMTKAYVDGMKDPEHRKHPESWAADVAKLYKNNVSGRDFVKYINRLVSQGKLPRDLRAQTEETGQQTFAELVKEINNKDIKGKQNDKL